MMRVQARRGWGDISRDVSEYHLLRTARQRSGSRKPSLTCSIAAGKLACTDLIGGKRAGQLDLRNSK